MSLQLKYFKIFTAQFSKKKITLNFWRSCFITSSVFMLLFILTLVSDPKAGVKIDV
jgi:hypothetical protein